MTEDLDFLFPPSKQARAFLKIGLALIPIAYISDCALDAILFGDESFWEQVISPSVKEICIRVVFSIFMLATTLIGVRYLALGSEREFRQKMKIDTLETEKLAINDLNHTLSCSLRGMMTEVSAQISLLEEQCHESGNDRLRFLADVAFKKANILEEVLNDLHQRSEIDRMK